MVSKIYIATDSSPVDIQTYELCSDMIDVVLDVASIYGCVRDVHRAARAGRRAHMARFDVGGCRRCALQRCRGGARPRQR